MEDQATLSLAQALTENENEFNEDRLSSYLRGSTAEAENDYNSKTSRMGKPVPISRGQAPAPKGSWVEIAEELAKPISGGISQRENQVRLETLSDTGLAMVFFALLLGVLLPWAVFDILLSAEDDDDSIYARGDCRLAYNASAVGDSLNYADDEVVDACDTEALAQLRIAVFLGAFTIAWAVRVAVHWGYCYCDACANACVSLFHGCRNGSSKEPNQVRGEEQTEKCCTSMAWPHGAVMLFLLGQILLEDPISAYAYHASGNVEQFVMSDTQRKWQSAGCVCMTFATLLLVDHCHRSGAAAAAASAPAAEVVEVQVSTKECMGALIKHGTSPSPGKFLAMALASCWSLFWYGLVVGDSDSIILESASSWPAQHRHAIRVFFCALSLGASVRWMVNAFRAVQAVPYMSHRYENLLLRLVLPSAFLDLLIVTIFADTFVVLYITTLILPLFLAFAHLPPGSAQLHPVIRHRRKFLAELIARRHAHKAKRRRARRQNIATANGGGQRDSQVGETPRANRNPAAAAWSMIIHATMQAKRFLESIVSRIAGALGDSVGIDFGVGTQAPSNHDEGDVDYWGGGDNLHSAMSEIRSSLGLAASVWERESTTGSSASGAGGNALQEQELQPNRRGNDSSSSEDEAESGRSGNNLDGNDDAKFSPWVGDSSNEDSPGMPALCLETALWGAQLSNLAYWDPTGPVPSFLEGNADNVSNSSYIVRDATRSASVNEASGGEVLEKRELLDLTVPSANGAGKLKDDVLNGLARHSIYLAAAIHDYGTGTHVHVYVQDHDNESANASSDKMPKRTRTVWVSFRGTSSAAELYYKDLDTKQMPLTLQSIVPQNQDHDYKESSIPGGSQRSNYKRRTYQCCCRCCVGCVLCATGLIIIGFIAFCCACCCRSRRDDKDAVAHAHRGFWVAYAAVRIRLFAVLSDIILSESSQSADGGPSSTFPRPQSAIVFCGHSLGGALASIAALDFQLAMEKGVVLDPLQPKDAAAATAALAKRQGKVHSPLQEERSPTTAAATNSTTNAPDPGQTLGSAAPRLQQPGSGTDNASTSSSTLPTIPSLKALRKRVACVECFTYGSPRPGDLPLAMLSRRFLPLCWRLVYEGDVITGVPRVHCGPFTCLEAISPRLCCSDLLCNVREYKHIGTPAFLGRKTKDRVDLLLNPSGVERVAYLQWATSVASHQLRGYLRALLLVAAQVPDLLGGDGHTTQSKGNGRGSKSRTSGGGASAANNSNENPNSDIELGRRSQVVTWSSESPSGDMDFQYASAMRSLPNKDQ